MKKLLPPLLALMFFLYALAEMNYQDAVKTSSSGPGTDSSIEWTMHCYGFDVEAMDPAEPTMVEKLNALMNIQKPISE